MSLWDRRGNNFDFMRLALAILVIYSHAFPLGTGSEAAEPLKLLTHGQVTGGALAVDSFFVMSGFLIAASAQRSSSVWGFLRKRVSRIYPAFVVSALLSAVVMVPLASARFGPGGPVANLAGFVLQTLRLTEFHYAGAFAGNPYPGVINGSIWSIPYEFWCYLGVAALMVTGLLRSRAAVLTLFAAAWGVSLRSQIGHWHYGGKLLGVVLGSPQFWARLLPLYLAGVVFYEFRGRIPLSGKLALGAAGALFAGCWFSFGWTLFFPFAGTYLLFWFAFTPAVRLHGFGRFGDFSYGTYLYAFPIEQLIVQAAGHALRPGLLFLYATPLTLLAAVASWYGVERRFLRPARWKETPVQVLEQVA